MERAYFREEQRFRQPWMWAVGASNSAVCFWILYRIWSRGGLAQEPLGKAVCVSLIALGGPTMFWWARLLTVVEDDRLHGSASGRSSSAETSPHRKSYGFKPRSTVPYWSTAAGASRWRPGKGKAYNVSGNRGVRLTLSDGEKAPGRLAASGGIGGGHRPGKGQTLAYRFCGLLNRESWHRLHTPYSGS